MKNVMNFPGGYQAVISYDPEIEMFRGEFVGLNGGADFYAKDAVSLKHEGQTSLDVFLKMCAEDSVPPKRGLGTLQGSEFRIANTLNKAVREN